MPLFKWQDARKTSDGGAFTRAIRTSLTAHLQYLQPNLESIVKSEMMKALHQTDRHGWAHPKIFPLMKHIVSKLNCYAFFGPELCTLLSMKYPLAVVLANWKYLPSGQDDEFVATALEYPQTTVFAAELVRNLPTFLCPLAAGLATNWGQAEKTLVHYLSPIVEERLRIKEKIRESGASDQLDKPKDVMQWMIDVSPQRNWTTTLMVGQILAVWVPSVHQISMVRISMITNPIVMRRKAVEPHILCDGSRVAKGDWICVPQQAIMKDGSMYRNPHEFDGFRFAKANEVLRHGHLSPDTPDKVETKLNDANFEWSVWGFDPAACPGRWYATLVIKLIIIHVLENWDCKLADKNASRSKTWRTNCFPRSDTIVSMRKLE
ncbi:cytochrome P450 [Cryphonectria parasitica EP155]|uniref:Cytochrome P450 n=1 Tax=Cryphonectria parasitica (strain ATCC 38755 / EP155) TaxID=660469 RepID=A0A9P5CMJ3_CRYP1|nr:cytochrome P450 [Cryphonectria parasitica EP155]KAF3762950.1 cytochrome P450 [Cryphonectria parasitica EP155]